MSAKILLIEDNEQNRYLVTFLLGKHGYEVISAFDGPTGIEVADRVKPQLILLDIQLPMMDGYTVARELRKNSSLQNIPIIAVTSYAMSGDREKLLMPDATVILKNRLIPILLSRKLKNFLNDLKRRTIKNEGETHSDCRR